MVQIFIIYGLYKIFSIIIPSRTFATSFVSLLFIGTSYFDKIMIDKTGFNFKIAEILDFKNTVAMFKILLTDNFNVSFAIIAVGLFVAIFCISLFMHKKASTYTLSKRFKGFLIGIAILVSCFVVTNYFPKTSFYKSNKNYGYTYNTLMHATEKNKYSDEFVSEISEEAKKLFDKDKTNEETTKEDENWMEDFQTETQN